MKRDAIGNSKMSFRERLRGLKIYIILEEIYLFFYSYSLELCVDKIPEWSGNNKLKKKILLVALFPYIFLKGIISFLYEFLFARIRARKIIKEDRKRDFKYNFAIVVIAKNEKDYIREWIAYHRIICGDKIHFYLYDNESTDDMKTKIQDYIDNGWITYNYFEGKHIQLKAYNDAINKYKNEARYLAFIDVDEFLVLKNNSTLTDYIVKKIESNKNAGGIGVNWKLFGSSGFEEKQEGLVTETFLRHGNESHWGNTHIKTICNPRLVKKYISPHYPQYILGVWNIAPNGKRQKLWLNKNVDWSELAIHHYFCKSKEEYEIKRNRGFVHSKKTRYDDKRFIQYDLNDEYDDVMLKYTEQIKKIL